MKPRAFVFHGTRPYGIHIAVADSLQKACKLMGLEPRICYKYMEERSTPPKYVGYEALYDDQVKEYGE